MLGFDPKDASSSLAIPTTMICGVMVSIFDFDSNGLGSNPGGSSNYK